MDIQEFIPRNMIPDDDCDGIDCPWWPICHDQKAADDPCPLLDRDTDPNKPLDKLIKEEW